MSLSENLHNLGALLKTNLETKGINGLTGNEGLTTLANKILDIEGSGSSSKSVVACVTGNSVTLGSDGYRWLPSIGSVVIDWGDGTSDTINNPSTSLSHTYTNANGHLIAFNGNITSLGDSCFERCSGLTGIIIPDSITGFGEGSFTLCSGLTNIIIPNSVTSLGNVCFSNCSGLTSIIIPSSVTNIGGACFNRCFGLTSVTISDSITSIEESCFSECSSLTSVVIPDSVTSIGEGCFAECSSLTSVVIPDSVTSIGASCFYGCSSLIDYELYWRTQPVTYDSAKMPVNNGTVFTIPQGTTSIYTDAGYPVANLVERVDHYNLVLSSTTPIIQTGDSATVTASLTHNNAAASSETLNYVVKHGSTTIDTGTVTTGSDGKASISYVGTGVGDVSFEFKYGTLLQETYELTDYIFNDDATVDKLSAYDINNQIQIYGSTRGTMTYDSSNQRYNIDTRNNSTILIPINTITPTNNLIMEADIYLSATESGCNLGLGFYNQSTNGSIQFVGISNGNACGNIYENSDHIFGNKIIRNKWVLLKVEVQGQNIVMSMFDKSDNSLIATYNYTMSLAVTSNTKVGLVRYNGGTDSTSYNGYIRNIKVKAL